DGQAGEDGAEGRHYQEDADAGVFFGPGVGAGALERVLQVPHQGGDPAPPGRHRAAEGRLRTAAIAHAVMVMHAHCTTSAAAAGAAGACSAGFSAGGGAISGRVASPACFFTSTGPSPI